MDVLERPLDDQGDFREIGAGNRSIKPASGAFEFPDHVRILLPQVVEISLALARPARPVLAAVDMEAEPLQPRLDHLPG